MNPAQTEARPAPPPAPLAQASLDITHHASRITLVFTHSAAALLLAMATALFVTNLTGPPHLVLPRDPISGISFRYLFWIVGAIAALLAFLCLFYERPARLIPWIAWLATNFLIYRIVLCFEGCHSLTGFLACVTYSFGIPAKAASLLADAAFAYLFIGSCALLLWQWFGSSKSPLLHHSTIPFLKMPCPACGLHIAFAAQDAGQKVPCPQCKTAVTLRKPDLLKTSCFFCKGHIEFPTYAVGQKIHCPHCKMDITLKEPV